MAASAGYLPRVKTAWLLLLCVACVASDVDGRSAFIVDALVEADVATFRTRPGLVVGKHGRMASDLYSYYRGAVPVFARDFALSIASRSDFALQWPMPLSTGDAHPENFGLLMAADGSLAVEPNDFDGADRYPYLWDLRRLGVGLVLAARLSNSDDAEAQRLASEAEGSLVETMTRAYRAALEAPGMRVVEGGAVVADLLRRGTRDRDARDELEGLTEEVAGARRIRRGVLDAAEPTERFLELPSFARDALRPALAEYRASLVDPPDASFFALKDSVRHLGSGVASWPRVRLLLLVEGPTASLDDDVLLELKELADGSAPGTFPPGRFYDDVGSRVRSTSRALWARRDAEPLWGTATFLGMPVQVRRESEAHKTVRVARLEEDEGTLEALQALAETLGTLLGRMHAVVVAGIAPGPAIARIIDTDLEGFVAEQVRECVRCADRVTDDWMLFRALVEEDPLFGVRPEASDMLDPELREVLGLEGLE